ncbi:peptidase S8/S53 domain-containing protein, partial [Lactarius quietus]
SGDGLSYHFPRPEFQDEAVPTFLSKLGDQHAGLCNAAGRGIPDVSAQALRFWFVLKGKDLFASGTSCSVPIVASIAPLLNDYLISNGKEPLGWLNPWLYGDGLAGLTDITDGNNPGCCNTEGFSAVPNGILFVLRDLCLHFPRWLILIFLGHWSRDAKLCSTTERT